MNAPKSMIPVLCFLMLTVLPVLGDARHRSAKPQGSLTVVAPIASFKGHRQRDGIRTVKYDVRGGIISTTQWPLILRFETSDSIAFLQEFLSGQRREALLLDDPDGCPVLTSLIDDIEDLGRSAFDPACAGLAEDETYFEVQSEKFDTFELTDNISTGNDSIQQRLIDDDCNDPAEPRNVACLRMDNGKRQPVGPKTGEAERDGYGYGADDDAAGAVIMVNAGGARVFDPDTFDLIPGTIRNMAGLINTVSEEILTSRGTTAITMTTHTLAGYLEPIALFDFSIADANLLRRGFNGLMRVDSGPLMPFRFVSEFPTNNNSTAEFNPFYDELLSLYYPGEFTIRAVIVAGEAPDFIQDLNFDGRFTAADVELAGYPLISNEIELTVRLINDNLLVESPDPKCPPRTLIFRDLDGDFSSGAPEKCVGTSGSTRGRRVPR